MTKGDLEEQPKPFKVWQIIYPLTSGSFACDGASSVLELMNTLPAQLRDHPGMILLLPMRWNDDQSVEVNSTQVYIFRASGFELSYCHKSRNLLRLHYRQKSSVFWKNI